MTLDDLLPFLGHSEQDPGLADLLASVGFDVALMPGRVRRGSGHGHCELPSLGLELAFDFHTVFKDWCGAPKDDGKAIFLAVFAYDRPGKKRQAYVGPIPFSGGPIHDRHDALREFGPPVRTETEDDVVEWDQWIKDGLQVRTTYHEDGSLVSFTYSVPFIRPPSN
jgi:hypothetical protein